MQKLEDNIIATGKMSRDQTQEYNRLDNIRIIAVTDAQRLCRKLMMGAIPYSPALSLAGKKSGHGNCSCERNQEAAFIQSS
jgi:hypothetical protein